MTLSPNYVADTQVLDRFMASVGCYFEHIGSFLMVKQHC